MPHLRDQRLLPYDQQQLFALISDVKSYPDFLPWCMGARVYGHRADGFDADLVIGFKAFRESFTSRVTLDAPHRVDVDYIRGPLRHLYNHWLLTPVDGGTDVVIDVDFAFKNPIFERMVGGLFTEASRKMINAFEARADLLFGKN